MPRKRTTTEVFEDHLRLRQAGDIEEDLRRNFAEDVVLLTVNSNECGHEAIRTSARRLGSQLPEGTFDYVSRQVSGPYALLVWTGTSINSEAVDGADSFVIEEGKIRMQTIHYRVAARRDTDRRAD